MYALRDALIPDRARLASTSAARALYLFGIGGGALAFALGSLIGGRVGALLLFGPAVIAAVLTWIAMGASSTGNPSSSAGA